MPRWSLPPGKVGPVRRAYTWWAARWCPRAVLHERIPTEWRVGLWLASALTADNPQVGYTLLPHSLWPVPA